MSHVVVGLFVVVGALVIIGRRVHRPFRRGAAHARQRRGDRRRRRAAHRVLDRPARRDVRLHGEHAVRRSSRRTSRTSTSTSSSGRTCSRRGSRARDRVPRPRHRDRGVDRRRSSPSCSASGRSCTPGTCGSCRSGTSGVFLLAAIGAAEIVRRLSGEFGRLWVGPPASPDEDVRPRPTRPHRPDLPRRHVGDDHRDRRDPGGRRASGSTRASRASSATGRSGTRPATRTRRRAADPNFKAEARKQYPEYRALIDRMARAPAGTRAVGGRELDRRVRHAARVDAAAVLDARSDPELRGPLLRVGREHAVRVHGDRAALGVGQRVEPGPRSRLPLDRELRRRRALPPRARRALLPRALAGGEGRRRTRTRGSGSSGRPPTSTTQPPEGWSIYEVRDHALVAPLPYEPVVVGAARGHAAGVLRRPERRPIPGPELGDWECVAAGWWSKPQNLDRPLAASGPAGWQRATAAPAPSVTPRAGCPPVRSPTCTRPTTTSASTSPRTGRARWWCGRRTTRTGRRTGADGPWRLSPNLMVVVPTAHDVTLHFARSGAEKVGAAGERRRSGRSRGARDLRREAAPSAPVRTGRDRADHRRSEARRRPAGARPDPGATMPLPPRGR